MRKRSKTPQKRSKTSENDRNIRIVKRAQNFSAATTAATNLCCRHRRGGGSGRTARRNHRTTQKTEMSENGILNSQSYRDAVMEDEAESGLTGLVV